MRIVDVCAFYTPSGGGVKTYVERKLRAGAEHGHEIIILAPSDSNDVIERAGGRIVKLAARRFPLDRRYHYFDSEISLHHMLDQLQPDVVEASSPWSSAAMVARWRGDAPRSLVMHADPLAAYAYRWFGRIASQSAIDWGFDWYWRHLQRMDRRFDLIVSASQSLSDRLTRGGLSRVFTLPMGVEPGHFAPNRRDESLRAHLLARCSLPHDATLLIGIGRHAPEKRWPMIIDAVASVGYSNPVGLVLIGDGRDQAKVRRAAAHNPHIHLLAPIHDRARLAAILASADALVHGCEAETFCMVAAEAKASGLPLIVPDQGGAADQARHGIDTIYRATDATDLARAIRAFVAGEIPQVRQRACAEADRVATMDDHFAVLFDTYERLRHENRDAA